MQIEVYMIDYNIVEDTSVLKLLSCSILPNLYITQIFIIFKLGEYKVFITFLFFNCLDFLNINPNIFQALLMVFF